MTHRSLSRRPLALLVALALLLPTLALAPPARAAACVVTSAYDTPTGGTLREKLADATCAAIAFQAGLGPIVLGSRLPTIARALTVQGPGADRLTVSGDDTFPLLFIAAPGQAVALSGLTLTRGRAALGYGGDLFIGGGTVAVTDVALTAGSAADGLGGAGAYIGGGTVAMTRVTVAGNTASGSSALQAGAGLDVTEYIAPTDLTIADSTIVGNTALGGYGGGDGGGLAIVRTNHVAGRALTVRLTNTVVGTAARPNRAYYQGGGIANYGGDLTLTGSTVGGNTAYDGGGIANYGGHLTVTGSTVSGNAVSGNGGGIYTSGDDLTVTGSTVSGNAVSGEGGGIYTTGGHLTLTGSTLGGNTARSGGGIANIGGTATVTNSTLGDNTALGGGGVYTSSGTTALRFATVTGNTAPTGGGLLQLGTGQLSALSSIVAGNRTTAGAPNDCAGTITSPGRNLWGDQTACPDNAALGDQNLAALNVPIGAVLDPTLANNGGPTPTHNLVAGSPAIDRGDNVTCDAAVPAGAGGHDQRGVARPQGAGCDIGAVEYQSPASPSPSPSASPSASPSPSPVGPAPSFADVPPGYWAHDQIITFAQRGITTGCGDNDAGQRLYCPERGVTRAEMAVFITRTLGQDKAAPPATPTFADVPTTYWAYQQIEAFAILGITTGCGTDDQGRRLFCPDRGVTRAEMAVFLDRAKGQAELANPAPTFADVPTGYWAYGFIERFYTLGITTGCGTDDQGRRLYCPDRGVTRAEMAVFLIRAYP